MVKCAIPGRAHPESTARLGGRPKIAREPAPPPSGSGLSGGAVLAARMRLPSELRLPRTLRQTSPLARRTCCPGHFNSDNERRGRDPVTLYGSELREVDDELWLLSRFEPQPHCALSPSWRRRLTAWRRVCR